MYKIVLKEEDVIAWPVLRMGSCVLFPRSFYVSRKSDDSHLYSLHCIVAFLAKSSPVTRKEGEVTLV